MNGMNVVNKKLYITGKCYEAIVNTIASAVPECGGILGTKCNNIISEYVFDKGAGSSAEYYIPDVDMLNKSLIEWDKKGIRFCGMIHSHLLGRNELSFSDIDYGKRILKSMNMENIYLLLVDTNTFNFNLTIFELNQAGHKKVEYKII